MSSRRPLARQNRGRVAGAAGTAASGAIQLWTLVSSVTCLRAWQSDFSVHNSGSNTCDSWTCQVSGATAIQAVAGQQPAIGTGVGSRTKLVFDGSNDVLRDATLDLPSPGTSNRFFWAVYTPITWTINKTLWSGGTTGGQYQFFYSVATPDMSAYDGIVGPRNSGAIIGSPVRAEVLYSNSIGDYVKLGATTVTGTALANLDPPAGFNIGGVSTGASAANFELYALLIFQGAPSGAELAALSAAAATMYPGVAV